MRDDKYRQEKKRQYPYQQNRRDFVEKPSKAKFSDVQDMEENSAVVEGRNAVFELMQFSAVHRKNLRHKGYQ